MSDLIIPRPLKGNDKRRASIFAIQYILELKKLYMLQCASGESDNLYKFIKFSLKNLKEVKAKVVIEKEEVKFAKDDIYRFEGGASLANKASKLETIDGTAEYLGSLYALYMTDNNDSKIKKNKISEFLKWISQYLKKLNTSTAKTVAKS